MKFPKTIHAHFYLLILNQLIQPLAAEDIAPRGRAILGTNDAIDSDAGTAYEHVGVASNVNDGDVTTKVDTWNNTGTDTASFVGIEWNEPTAHTITTMSLTMATFVDGGWFGTNGSGPGAGNPLDAAAHLTTPTLQVSTDMGTTWTSIKTSNNYVEMLSGHAIGGGTQPNPSATRTAVFTLRNPQSQITGIRLIGEEGGTASNGFIGVFELGVEGILITPDPEGLLPIESPKLVPDATALGFGKALALDGNYMAVGSPEENGGNGAVRVYKRSVDEFGDIGWSRIFRRDGAIGAKLGTSVAIEQTRFPSLTDPTSAVKVVIGAPGEAGNSGAAYVYGFENDDLTSSVKLFAPAVTADSSFGKAVAIELDLVAVGAPSESIGGRVQLFEESGGFYQPIHTLEPDRAGFLSFGGAIAINGPYVFVGAPGLNSSHVYIFNETLGFQLTQRLDPVSGGGGFFGKALAIGNVYVAEGLNPVLLIGSGGLFPEPAYLYEQDPTTLRYEFAKRLNPSPGNDPPNGFGTALAIHRGRAVITGSGRFHVFDVNEPVRGNWGLMGSSSSHELSGGVALDGIHVIAGAPGDDEAGQNAGAVRTYRAGPYEQWAAKQGSAFRRVASHRLDPDRDGCSNLEEFALGSNPLSAISIPKFDFSVHRDGVDGSKVMRLQYQYPNYNTEYLSYSLRSVLPGFPNFAPPRYTGGRMRRGIIEFEHHSLESSYYMQVRLQYGDKNR